MSNITAGNSYSIILGNVIDVLGTLQDKIDCVVTSPPYFNQRNYGSSTNELGQEGSVAEYILKLVNVFQTIPLEPWASVWVNIGDKRGEKGELQGIPERFCIAMNDAGFLRIDSVIWAKESVQLDGTSVGHCMIEPAARRLNGNGHEPFYRFVLNPKLAWTDTCAVRIPRENVADVRYLPAHLMKCHTSIEGRNLTNVWNVPMGQTKENHHAVFPSALLERPIAMTCPLEITENGPKRRVVKMAPYPEARPSNRSIGKCPIGTGATRASSGRQDTGRQYVPRKPLTLGWEPGLPTIRKGIVLDPFSGTGTTGQAALLLGRHYIGIELYPDYVQISEQRCEEAKTLRCAYESEASRKDDSHQVTAQDDKSPNDCGEKASVANSAMNC